MRKMMMQNFHLPCKNGGFYRRDRSVILLGRYTR
jgi:hypothetical protein